ncbi:MAG: sensor histidine kinase [bacterium]
MNALIDDLLVYSRVGRGPKTSVTVDLGRIVDRAIAEIEPTRRETGGQVRRGDLPMVAGDEIQLGQVFQNLISNGLKFVEPGVEPEVVIEAEAEPGEAMCRISITDNGIGVPTEERDRVFAMFTRLHGQDEFPGTGIGLAICRKIVERHGGTITARSTPGQGATFIVTLPIRTTEGG